MKKRMLSAVLALAITLALLPLTALAAGRNYGDMPIYVGYSDVDYMAEEILNEIPTQGKSDIEKIRAVYDWITENYGTSSWLMGNTPVFREAEVKKLANQFYQQADAALKNGAILIRLEHEDKIVFDSNYGQYVLSSDSNQYISAFAKEMLLVQSGNSAHYASLLALLLGHLGFDCRVISGSCVDESGVWSEQTWNYVLVDGQYYWLDVQLDAFGTGSSGKYFMVKDNAAWNTTHHWDEEYPAWLTANATEIAEEYSYNATLASGKPWSRCADWAEDQMKQAYQAGLIPQRLQNRDLMADISRAEFAAVAVAMYEKLSGKTAPAYTGENPFTDTDDADVLKAYSLGVVKGTGGTLYSPDGTLTREQAMTMLGRVYELVNYGKVGDGSSLPQGDIQKFADDAAISSFAYNYIYFFVGNGVVNGVGENLLAPLRYMDRQSAIKMTVEAAKLS